MAPAKKSTNQKRSNFYTKPAPPSQGGKAANKGTQKQERPKSS